MSRSKPKTQRRYWGRVNTLQHVSTHASPLRPHEIAHIMAPKLTALEQARAAQLTEDGYYALTTAVIIGQAIEDQGVVRGLQPQITDAWRVLTDLGRSMDLPSGWAPHALRGPQIDAIDTLLWAHGEQLKCLQYNEWQAAQRLAEQRTRSVGGTVELKEQHHA